MSKPDWKRTERKIAAQLGGQRVPVTGRARGDAPDIAHEWLSIEVKHKAKLPDWLHEAVAQAEASKRGAQLPVAVLHESGQRHAQDFVVMRLSDFRQWLGSVQKSKAE